MNLHFSQNVIKPAQQARTRRIIAAVLLASLATLTACETTSGLGQDVKKLGGNIENSADRNK